MSRPKIGIVVTMILCVLLCLCGCRTNNPFEVKHVHHFVTQVVLPTCSKEGYTIYTCTSCGFIEWDDFVPAVEDGGHSYVDCICTECGDFLIDEAVDTDVLEYERATDANGNEVYKVAGVGGDRGYIKIPSVHDGLPVTGIADGAFLNDLELKHVVIPESVVHIGDEAFKYCLELLSVTILGGELSLGSEAFMDCTKLKDVDFEGIVGIGEYAFLGCIGISNVVLSDKLTEIGPHAFDACRALKSVTIPVGVTELSHGTFLATEILRISIIRERSSSGTISTRRSYTIRTRGRMIRGTPGPGIIPYIAATARS